MCRYSLLTVRRFRPFARRRLSTRRPFLVLMRTRNPWVRLRCRLFGWNVRFPFMTSPRLREQRNRTANGSEGVPKVSIGGVCAKVGVLQPISLVSDPSRLAWRIWSVPKDFHTCGKNCGNSPEFKHPLGFRTGFPRVFEGGTVRGRIKMRRFAATCH